MKVQDQQRQENSEFVASALFLKKAEIKLGIPLLNTGTGRLKINVDSPRLPTRVRHTRAADEPGQPQQPAPGRPSAARARAKIGPHSRRCNICRHPHREDIEQEFLRWRSPDRIAQDYKIPDHSSIYRHVHATGIFARRRKAVRAALEPIIECAEFVEVTASSLVKAIHAFTHISEDGEWINHPTQHTVIVRHTNVPEESNPPATDPPSPLVDQPVVDQPVAHTTTKEPLSPPPSHTEPRASAPAVPLTSASAQSTELNRQIAELKLLQLSENKGRRSAQIAKKIKKWTATFFTSFPITEQTPKTPRSCH